MTPLFVVLKGRIGGLGQIASPPAPGIPSTPSGPSTPSLGGALVTLGYLPAPSQMPAPAGVNQAASDIWVRRISEVVNSILTGKMNVTLDVTLTAGASTTTLTDARLSVATVISFCPLTAHAAAELAAGTLYVSARTNGTMTLTHANNAQADREFDCTLIG